MAEEQWLEVNPMDIPLWQYQKPGDELIGYLKRVEHNIGPNGSRMYTFSTDDGKQVKVWGNTLLDTRFDYISVGEKVKIVYLGKKKSPKTGREYHDFKVYHQLAKNSEDLIDEDDIPVIEDNPDINPDEIPF